MSQTSPQIDFIKNFPNEKLGTFMQMRGCKNPDMFVPPRIDTLISMEDKKDSFKG